MSDFKLNALATVSLLHYTIPGGSTFDHNGDIAWYSANATHLFGESLIKVGSNWQLANPFPGGATAPLNGAFALALDFTLVSPSAWTNAGVGLTGVPGIPQLAGTGTLAPGSAGALNLTSARPSAPAMLFFSLTATCREIGVEPRVYLWDVMQRIGTESDVAKLTPHG